MTEHAKHPEHPRAEAKAEHPRAEARPEEKKAERPEKADSDARKAAKKVLAEYRKEYPGDDREDEFLLTAANGAHEIAAMDARHEAHRAERMRRLAKGHPKNKVD